MISRRKFIHASCLSAAATMAGLDQTMGSERQPVLNPFENIKVQPTLAQRAWMELKYGLFIHFGPNTINGTGWGDGKFPSKDVVFPKLDIKQWAAVARDSGMKYAVLTTKHHDGFCLWPSDHTDYCIKQSPQGIDIVGEFVKAFTDAGVKPGFYYSTWDRNCSFYDDDIRYAEYMRKQVKELLITYGNAVEWWFDGSWDKDHPTKSWEFNPKWEKDADSGLLHGECYEWKALYELIHSLQSDSIVLHNSSSDRPGGIRYMPCDARTAEQFDFIIREKLIEPVINPIINTPEGKVFLPLEFESTLSPNWFWDKSDYHFHPSVATITDWYIRARTANANLLLNVGPNMDGLIPDYNIQFLKKVREKLSL